MTPLPASLTRPGLALLVGIGGLALAAATALADDAPVLTPPANAALDEASQIQAPAPIDRATVTPPALDPGMLESREIAPDPRFHKGCVYTDMSADRSAGPLTERELTKLAMGRAAVEAARAAGPTIDWSALLEDDPPPPEDLEAMKLQRLRDTVPAPLSDDPLAGVGDFPAIQELGPQGLTAYEIDKLNGLSPAPIAAEQPRLSAERTATGDGAPAPREEVTSHD